MRRDAGQALECPQEVIRAEACVRARARRALTPASGCRSMVRTALVIRASAFDGNAGALAIVRGRRELHRARGQLDAEFFPRDVERTDGARRRRARPAATTDAVPGDATAGSPRVARRAPASAANCSKYSGAYQNDTQRSPAPCSWPHSKLCPGLPSISEPGVISAAAERGAVLKGACNDERDRRSDRAVLRTGDPAARTCTRRLRPSSRRRERGCAASSGPACRALDGCASARSSSTAIFAKNVFSACVL